MNKENVCKKISNILKEIYREILFYTMNGICQIFYFMVNNNH